MSNYYKNYFENFPNEFSISHKISSETEKKKFHMHKQYEILYTLSDNLKCRTEHGIFSLPSHAFILFNTMDLHYVFSDDSSNLCNRYVIYFSSAFISTISSQDFNLVECFQTSQVAPPVMLVIDELQHINYQNLMNKMIECLALANRDHDLENRFYHIMRIRFLLGDLLLFIHQLYNQTHNLLKRKICQKRSDQVMEICDYIRLHLQEELSTDFLANEFHISKTQLYNLFKEVLGMTAIDFLTECRISYAKDYLLNTDYPVELIGDMSGYHTLSAFSRSFKLFTGLSPQQYRKYYQSYSSGN